jgi:diguanylate cyclase (GGDEF)-like protein/PAS domain S-box-containing protein
MTSSTAIASNPLRWRLFRLIWPFVAIVVLLLAFGATSMQVIRGVRAYQSAESIRASAEQAAIEALEQYAQARDESAFSRYVDESAIIAGVRAARLELDKRQPDLEIVRRGFLRAGSHPDDVDEMVDLFRRYRVFGFMEDAVTLWADADARFARVDELARALQRDVQRGNYAGAGSVLTQMRALDRELTSIERAFSVRFATVARRVEFVLAVATLCIGVALVIVALVRTRRLIFKEDIHNAALLASQQRYDYAISGTNDGIWDWTVAHPDIYFSPRFEEMLGYPPGALRKTPAAFIRLIHPADRRPTLARLREHLASGEPFDLEFQLRRCSGEYRWVRTRGRAVMGERGRPQRMAGSLADISDRKLAEARTLQEKERAQVTLASIADAVITIDAAGNIEYVNPVAERLTGWLDGEARGVPPSTVFSVLDEATGEEVFDPVARAFHEGTTVTSDGNVMLRRRHDAPVAIDYSVAPIRNRESGIVGVVVVFHDMSRERQYAMRLAHLASHDGLTGLLNRREFERRVDAMLVENQYEPGHHAVLYLDLDRFKVVNDTCGHAAGDELLRQVSARLRPRLREGDTLARLGGDEFGVLLEHCAPIPALALADALRKTIDDFHFQWSGRSFRIGVSVGLVNVDRAPQSLAGVLSAADAACYAAKNRGRNRVHVYSANRDDATERDSDVEWTIRIQHALAESRFCLFAQPVYATDGATDEPAPYTELLLRLRGKNGELVGPQVFLPAAERHQLLPGIDRWVVRTAFARFAGQSATERASRGIWAINLSGASVGDDDFAEFVQAQLAEHRIAPARICFEITEAAAVAALSKVTEFMTVMRALGCHFALDDFGSGISSFAYLKQLPADFVKIDGRFVERMTRDPVDHAMVESIHRIACAMGKQTIAEWVADTQTLLALGAIGVDYVQGYGVGMPVLVGESPVPGREEGLRATAGR